MIASCKRGIFRGSIFCSSKMIRVPGRRRRCYYDNTGAKCAKSTPLSAAREALRIRQPNLLVADVGLAGEDGYMLIREVRRWEQEEKLAPVRAVAVTAFASAEDRRKALAAGFDEHIPKPLNPERFIAALARLMNRS